jgi:hypothetical protein
MTPLASSGFWASPQSTMFLMIGAAVLMAAVIGLTRYWVRRQRDRALREPADPNTVEYSQSYRRCVATAAWSGGSMRSWDHRVRPLLADLVDVTFADRHGSHALDAAREHLGDELWSLVDRNAERARDDLARAPGRRALEVIIGRLEEAV